jgi:hypothetical protein
LHIITVDFTKKWLIQLRDYRLKVVVFEYTLNKNSKYYSSVKLSSEDKVLYEKAIAACKQQATLFIHIAGSLPELQSQAIILRYGQSDKAADPLLVKEAIKEIHRIMKALLKSGELQLAITTDGYHIIRWLKPVIESNPLLEDDSEQEIEENLSDPRYIEWLMQKDY